MLNDSMPLNYKMQPHAKMTQQKANKQMQNKRKNEYIRVNNRNEKKIIKINNYIRKQVNNKNLTTLNLIKSIVQRDK